MINVLFNTDICESKVSHKSVTRDVCFIEGRGEIFDLITKKQQERKIIVADTVGLCDTEWDDKKVFELIKGRVSRNFKSINAVFVVFRADRLLREYVTNIKKVMSWLDYENGSNYLNFLFVGMFAENLSQNEKDKLKGEAREILQLKEIPDTEYESLVYVGFPPEENLNDNGKAQIKNSWCLLQPLVRLDYGKQLEDYHEIVKKQTNLVHELIIKLKQVKDSCTIL